MSLLLLFRPRPVAPPPAEAVAAALAGACGPVSYFWRFFWRDDMYNFLGDATEAVEQASVTLNNDSPIVWSAQMTLNPANLPAGFVAGQHNLAPVMYLFTADGYASYSLGLYRVDYPSEGYDPGGIQTWQARMADVLVLLQRQRVKDAYVVPAGTNYVTAIEDLIDSVGLSHSIPATAKTTPIAFTWQPNTDKLSIANALCEGINYEHLYASSQGVIRSFERTLPSGRTADVMYSDDEATGLIWAPLGSQRPYQRQVAVLGIANTWTIYPRDANRSDLTWTATAQILDAQSPINTGAIGEVSRALDGDRLPLNGTDRDDIVEYAAALADSRTLAATLLTVPDPRRGPHEVYELSIDGVENASKWRVNGWTISTRNGTPMTHRLGRARTITIGVATT